MLVGGSRSNSIQAKAIETITLTIYTLATAITSITINYRFVLISQYIYIRRSVSVDHQESASRPLRYRYAAAAVTVVATGQTNACCSSPTVANSFS